MTRMNDVGGMEGFGPIEVSGDEEAFHADWETRVFAIHRALSAANLYTTDEFRDAIERMPPAEYLAASYYERWLTGIRTLLVEKGVIAQADMPTGAESSHEPHEPHE